MMNNVRLNCIKAGLTICLVDWLRSLNNNNGNVIEQISQIYKWDTWGQDYE